jgi:hypothetical protein
MMIDDLFYLFHEIGKYVMSIGAFACIYFTYLYIRRRNVLEKE